MGKGDAGGRSGERKGKMQTGRVQGEKGRGKGCSILAIEGWNSIRSVDLSTVSSSIVSRA